MSVIVNANNQLIFGNQSPLYRVVTEPGLKDSLTHMLVDKSTSVYRKRAFDTYVLANSIFPNKSVEINDNVKYAIGKLLDPFISKSIGLVNDNVMKTPRQKYSQGEVILTNEIAKATGIKSTLVMVVDSEKELLTSCHGITTYLTSSVVGGVSNAIEASWSNRFFTFKDAPRMSALIFVPKQYIASILTFVLSNFKTIGDNSLDNISIKGELIDAFAIDLIKSFFSAIYADGIKSRVISDIMLYNKLLQKEGSIATAIAEDSGSTAKAADTFAKYSTDLRQFKDSSNSEHFVYELVKQLSFKKAMHINPYEFYKGFLDVPYVQVINIFERIPSFQRLNSKYCSNYSFSNNLFEMDIFNVDKDRDIVAFGIKLIRFLPFMLFNTYVLGGGSTHTETSTIIGNIKSFISSLNAYRSTNVYSDPIVKFISSNLDYIINDFYKEISSPLAVTNKSKSSLAIAIDKYGITTEDDTSEPEENKFSILTKLFK